MLQKKVLITDLETHLQSLSVFRKEVDGLEDVSHNSIYLAAETAVIIQNITEKRKNFNPSWFDGVGGLRKFRNSHKDDNLQCLMDYKTKKKYTAKFALKKRFSSS